MKYSIPLIFFWVGFVCAISFMEAWLKFQAPGVTIPLGLGIGRLVFGMMNKIEWIIALLILAIILWKEQRVFVLKFWPFVLPVLVLLIQTFYMLPFLDERAEVFIQGGIPEHSNMHFVYIASEMVKVSSLLIFGFQRLKGND